MPPRLPVPFLSDISRNTGSMAEDTKAIPDLRRDIERVAEATAGLDQIDARMANIEAAMPVLVEVQQHLSRMPETIEGLDRRIADLSVLLQQMLESMNTLATSIDSMQEAVGPLGRLARRLPRQGRDRDAE